MNPGVYKIMSLNYNEASASPIAREVGRVLVNDMGQIDVLEDRHGIVARLVSTDPSNAKINFERLQRSQYWKVLPVTASVVDDSEHIGSRQRNIGDLH